MENQETVQEPESEQAIKECVESVARILENTYELELNNFERLRLRVYAKNAIERERKNRAAGVGISSWTNPVMEMLELFLTREFGISEEDIHKIYELTLPGNVKRQYTNELDAKRTKNVLREKGHHVGMIRTSKPTKDFKQYLKILQERNR